MSSTLVRAALSLGLLAACSDGEVTAPAGDGEPLAVVSEAGDDLVIETGWVRAAAQGGNSAAYLTLRSDAADVLTGGVSTAFEIVELHESTREDGIARMQAVERIDLPAGEAVSLEPGGYHVMMMGAREAVEAGGTVPLLLEFGSGRSIEIDLPVRPIAQSGHMDH